MDADSDDVEVGERKRVLDDAAGLGDKVNGYL